MKLVNEHYYFGIPCKKDYEGSKGTAILTKNFGNKDDHDRWAVTVVVNGEYKQLAKRAEFAKAYAMAENEIQ